MSTNNSTRTVAVIQARMASSRLPGKVMEPLHEMPLIGFLLNRVRQCTEIDQVILATTVDPSDDVLASYVESLGISVIRSYEDDVLGRFVAVLDSYPFQTCVRITGDCPF